MSFCFSIFYLENLLPDLSNRHGLVPMFPSSMDGWPAEGLPRWLRGKESACQCRKPRKHGFNPWVGKFPGEGNDNPLEFSCLENPMDWGARQAIVHGATKSQTQLSMHAHTHRYYKKPRFSHKWGSIVSHYQTAHFSQILLQEQLLQVPASVSEGTPHSFQFSSIMRMVKQDWPLGLNKALQIFSFPWHWTWDNPEERGNTFSQQRSKMNSYLIWIFLKYILILYPCW